MLRLRPPRAAWSPYGDLPECEFDEIDTDDFEEGDTLSCPECGKNLVLLANDELDFADEDDEDLDDDEDEEELDEDEAEDEDEVEDEGDEELDE